jgi:hypothetical protein
MNCPFKLPGGGGGYSMKETPRRTIALASSLNEISTDQLGNRVCGGGGGGVSL